MIKLGLDCKLFRGTAGTTAATEMKNVKNVTLNLEKAEADITTRAASGWRVYAGTLKEASIEFEMLYDTEDADFTAILNAFLEGTALSMFVSDGSGNGLDCDVVITNCGQDQQLEEGVNVNVTARPTVTGGETSRAPKWTTAAA